MRTVWIVQQFRSGPGRQLLQTTVFASHAAAKERFLEALNERDTMTEIREQFVNGAVVPESSVAWPYWQCRCPAGNVLHEKTCLMFRGKE